MANNPEIFLLQTNPGSSILPPLYLAVLAVVLATKSTKSSKLRGRKKSTSIDFVYLCSLHLHNVKDKGFEKRGVQVTPEELAKELNACCPAGSKNHFVAFTDSADGKPLT